MFGYIRPLTEEMRVREYAYYRAVYCGLCGVMKKRISPLLSLTLRYDFVLLSLVRMLLSGEEAHIAPRRCGFNPLHKRPTAEENDALLYSARAAAILTEYGLRDTLSDEGGVKRLGARLAHPITKGMYRKAVKAGALEDLDGAIGAHLARLSRIERSDATESPKEASPDAAAEPFGEALALLFSHGCKGAEARIAETAGRHIGRYIYLCDAADDAPKDAETGSYNPFVTAAKAEGLSIEDYLSKYKETVRVALIMECRAALNALVLCDGWETHPSAPCIENILTYGMVAVAEHVTEHPGIPLSKKDAGK